MVRIIINGKEEKNYAPLSTDFSPPMCLLLVVSLFCFLLVFLSDVLATVGCALASATFFKSNQDGMVP
jgi:hypothetical protein